MKQNIIRVMILAILIGLCIWQSITLWLGGSIPSHHFFAENTISSENSYVRPKQIWSNINGNIYRMNSNSIREKVLKELIMTLRQDRLNTNSTPREEYAQLLFETQGLIFEFGTELTADEIIGQNIRTNQKYEAKPIKAIYVDLSSADTYKISIYLVDATSQITQKITMNTELKLENSVMELYKQKNEEADESSSKEDEAKVEKVYQASILSSYDSEFFTGNVFYPKNNTQYPMMRNKIRMKPIIENNQLESRELENYVNSLFSSPLYIKSYKMDEGIAFSDNINLTVKYHNRGILEFEKTTLGTNQKLTKVQQMNCVQGFIDYTEAIPKELKMNLYLTEIKEDQKTGEKVYLFGYRCHNGEIMILTNDAKRQLGINAVLELRMKQGEVVKGKWLMLIPEETQQYDVMTMESKQAIETIYEQNIQWEDDKSELNDLTCAYVISDFSKPAEFEWVGIYEKQQILVTKKNDSVE